MIEVESLADLGQPETGETVVHCNHVFGADVWHWFKLVDVWEFKRPDGTHGKSQWCVLCEPCYFRTTHNHDPERIVRLIGGDSTWEGNRLSNGAEQDRDAEQVLIDDEAP